MLLTLPFLLLIFFCLFFHSCFRHIIFFIYFIFLSSPCPCHPFFLFIVNPCYFLMCFFFSFVLFVNTILYSFILFYLLLLSFLYYAYYHLFSMPSLFLSPHLLLPSLFFTHIVLYRPILLSSIFCPPSVLHSSHFLHCSLLISPFPSFYLLPLHSYRSSRHSYIRTLLFILPHLPHFSPLLLSFILPPLSSPLRRDLPRPSSCHFFSLSSSLFFLHPLIFFHSPFLSLVFSLSLSRCYSIRYTGLYFIAFSLPPFLSLPGLFTYTPFPWFLPLSLSPFIPSFFSVYHHVSLTYLHSFIDLLYTISYYFSRLINIFSLFLPPLFHPFLPTLFPPFHPFYVSSFLPCCVPLIYSLLPPSLPLLYLSSSPPCLSVSLPVLPH